jgi:hypothetical protein
MGAAARLGTPPGASAPPLDARAGRRRPGTSLAPLLGADADLIEAAAWLHDTGYAPGLDAMGLHQLDGAPGTFVTPRTPMPCCAGWSPITTAP